jgi:hypothetical protein
MNTRKTAKVKSDAIFKELQEVDKLFRYLEKDKNLPTFGEHFMECLMFGVAENVNLKKMYPKTYFKLSKWLARHNKSVVAAKKNYKMG